MSGRVLNADGDVFLTNLEGSVSVTGELRAGSLNISATGDFNLTTEDWFHAGPDPRQVLDFTKTFGASVYNAAGQFSGKAFAPSGAEVGKWLAAMDTAAAKSAVIFSMGAIDINARYLNLDGVIQSGVDNIELTIEESFNPGKSTNFTDAQGNLVAGLKMGGAGLASITGSFDAVSGTILLDDIKPIGGVINLTGTIVSTGYGVRKDASNNTTVGLGALKVASGYASVKIENKSAFALAAGVIDTSENRVGRVTITDTSTLKRQVYTFQNGGFTQEGFAGTLSTTNGVSSITYSSTGKATGSQASLQAPLIYQPEPDRFYVWTEGQAKTTTRLDIYEDKSFNLLGFDWDGLVPDRAATSSTTRITDGTPLLESEVVITSADLPRIVGAIGAPVFAEYQQKRNLAIDLITNKSLVRDVKTNKLYLYVGTGGKVQFPVIDFTSPAAAGNWQFKQQLTGGKALPDPNNPTSTIIKATDKAPITWVEETGKSIDWSPDKDKHTFESDFENQEITTITTTTGGGWLRQKVITTKVTTVTGLKDFYTYSLRADLPVTVSTVVGASKPSVQIITPGKLLLRGSIALGGVPDEATETFTPLDFSSDALEVGRSVVFSGALPTIKANSDVTITVTDPVGRLNILASGNIVVEHLKGPIDDAEQGGRSLKIGQVIAGTLDTNKKVVNAFDVTIKSVYGIENASALNSRIIGERISLDGGTGGYGSRLIAM